MEANSMMTTRPPGGQDEVTAAVLRNHGPPAPVVLERAVRGTDGGVNLGDPAALDDGDGLPGGGVLDREPVLGAVG
jgi:hypothetical protein